jgi:O-antigen/teichoic acid export membrane protein
MLVRHTSQYMVSSAVTAVLGFMSAAVFTRLLTPADYGIYVVGFSMANFIAATIFTWVRYSVMRFEAEGGAVDVRITSLAAYFVSAATTPILLLTIHFVFHATWERAGFAVAVALGMSLFDLGQEILRSRLNVRAFMIGSVLRSAVAFVVCIGIAEFGGGGFGQLGGAALAYFVSSLISARAIWRGPRAPIDWDKLKLFLWLGASVTAAGFLVTFQASLDRLFIAWRFGDVEAGLYGAAADVVKQIILIPAGSVAAAAFPLTVRAFARGDAAETQRQLERTGELLFAVLAPAAVGLALTAPYLVSFLLGPAFRETAATIMPILAFAWLFQSISQSYIHVSFHLAMRQDLAIPHGLATLATNFALLWPMTSIFGPTGAAWSLLASEIIGAAAGYALTWKAHRLPTVFNPGRRILFACATMALCVFALELRLPGCSAGSFIALALTGAVVYATVAVTLNVCDARAFVLNGLQIGLVRLAPKRSAAGQI